MSPRGGPGAAPDCSFRGLHVLVDDDERWPRNPIDQAREACEGGAHVVQLRAKNSPDRQTLAWAREIRALTLDTGARFVLNDRFDLALVAGADGVHLGQGDIPPSELPAEVLSQLAVGRSTHTLAQARASLDEPVDYVAFGPVYGTTSKVSDYGRRGIELLGEVAALVAPRPLVAIGGISLDRVGEVIRSGASGIAVISAVAEAGDPKSAAAALCRAIAEAGPDDLQENGR